MLYTFAAHMRDRPGVLSRVTSLVRRFGLNIEALSVGHTERPGISSMTAVINLEERRVRQVEANLNKLLDVMLVKRICDAAIARELAMIKVPAGETLAHILSDVTEEFHARIVDRSVKVVVLEVAGTAQEIDRFAELLSPCGILEMVRTGPIALAADCKLAADQVLEVQDRSLPLAGGSVL
jgi:acetolactate synthase-1/3 small subunit